MMMITKTITENNKIKNMINTDNKLIYIEEENI